jgi:LacI family transcriptional regulator
MPDLTLRQLAALAGVSHATVSLALRNSPRLPEKTRKRIQRLAAKHGHRQDPVVSSLMAKLRTARVRRTTERIAFLTAWQPYPGWEDVHLNERYYLEGMRSRAHELGYEVEHICSREPGMTPKRISRILYTRAIKGVIVAPLFGGPGAVELTWDYFATATLGYSVVNPPLHRVTHSHFNGMLLALRELGLRGYKRCGYATQSAQDDRVNHNWLGALLAHQRTLPPEGRVSPLIEVELTPEVIKKWIQNERPDVVISNLPEMPALLEAAGFVVPGDMAFASLDLFSAKHTFSGVDQMPFAMGEAVAGLVVKQVQNNEFGLAPHPVTLQLDGMWRDGSTTRKAPRSRTRR